LREESGRAWIVKEAMEIAKLERIPIKNPKWALDTKRGTSLPEQGLCFDLRGKRHALSFSDTEIDNCAEPAYASERSIVSQRLRETLRRLWRQTK